MIWFLLFLLCVSFIPILVLEIKIYCNKIKIQKKLLKLLDLDITIDEV